MTTQPTFEECAAVVAGYLGRGDTPGAESAASANQVTSGFCKYKLLARATELFAADPKRFTDMSDAYHTVAEMLEYFENYRLATWAPLASIIDRERKPMDELHRPRPFCDWHEDRGDVLWWRIPISESPYVGHPLIIGASWSLQVYDGAGNEVGTRENHRFDVGGWPFDDDDIPHLWWTPLPDAKRIEDQVPL